MKFISALAAALLAATVAPMGASAKAADLVIWGGPIYTGAKAGKVEAVAVSAGRITYVGTRAGAQAQVGPATQTVDLKGAALFPGFTDSHAHLRGIGERELT